MKSENSLLSLLNSKSNLDILETLLNSNELLQFKDFKQLTNPKTQKKYSTRTLAQSLKELEKNQTIENKITIKSKRKVIGYSITPKGKQALLILKEANEKYNKL